MAMKNSDILFCVVVGGYNKRWAMRRDNGVPDRIIEENAIAKKINPPINMTYASIDMIPYHLRVSPVAFSAGAILYGLPL